MTIRRILVSMLATVTLGACSAPLLLDPARPVDVPDCRWSPPHLCATDRAVRVWLDDGTTFVTDVHTAQSLARAGELHTYEPLP